MAKGNRAVHKPRKDDLQDGGKKKLAAEIKVEGRDFVFEAARLEVQATMLKDLVKNIRKRIETVEDALIENMKKGVTEGPRAGVLFQSLEESRQESQKGELARIETAVGLANFVLECVGQADLKVFRAGCRKVGDDLGKARTGTGFPAAGSTASEPNADGKSQASGANGKEAAG